MLKNSLIEILRTFSKEELKRFNDFIISPYINKKLPVTRLWNVIKNYSMDFTSEDLERETVWKNLFPGKKFNYGVMKNLIWSLQKLAERFIELEVYEHNKYEQKNNLLSGLWKKNLINLYEKNLKAVKSEIDNSVADPDNFYYKYIFEANEQNYLNHFRMAKEPGFCDPFIMNENLFSFFFAKFFIENYNSLLLSKFYNKAYDTDFITEVFKFFENSISKNNEHVLVFYYCLKLLINSDDDEAFNLLKRSLNENFKKFNGKVSFNIGMSLIGYCSFNLMKGKLNFINDQFEICRLLVENNLYNGLETEYITGSFFVKVVSSASISNEFEWAEKFIQNFKEKLYPDKKEHFLILSQITLNIKRKNFDAAMNYLSKAEAKELVQKINIKRYQIMIYYELGYIDELYSFIDTSKHFISNDVRSSEEVKKTFFNFISVVLKLVKLKSDSSKTDIELFKKEIISTESTNKIWLLEKISEFQ